MNGPSDDDPGAMPPTPPPPEPPPGVDLGKGPGDPPPPPPAYPPAYGAPPGYPPPGAGYGGPPPGYPPGPGYGGPPPGYPPGPGYGGPPPGYGPTPPPGYPPYPGYGPAQPTNGLATGALFTGIASVACCPLTGPIALFLGIRARRQIRETGQQGDGYAMAGIITGAIGTLIVVGVVAFYLLGAVLAFSTRSEGAGRRSTLPPPTQFRTPTTDRSRTTGTGPSAGPSAGPSSTLLPVTCVRLRSAIDDFKSPAGSSPERLNGSAATLLSNLGPGVSEDVADVLVESLSRAGQRGESPDRPEDVLAALDRLESAVVDLCGP